jgi:hypothetical protein
MTLKQYLLVMSVGTALALGVFILALFKITPRTASPIGLLIFYAGLFLTLMGLLSIIGFVWRAWVIKQDEPHFRLVAKSFRHAALLSVLLILALILQSQRYLKWWAVSVLVIIFTITEVLLSAKTKERAYH